MAAVALLELDHVTQRFGGLVALSDVSLEVPPSLSHDTDGTIATATTAG